VVLWGHGYSKNPRRIADWQRNRIGRQAAGVLLYTHSIADTLVRHRGFNVERVFVAQNALDQTAIAAARKRWLAEPARLAAFQRQRGLDPENTIIFVSRLLRENRVDLLIQGLARLRETRPHARLVLVGDGPEAANLRNLAASLRLEGQVTFTGAIYDEEALAPWMLSASLFAYATNVGLSLMHAFGYGLPAITTDAIGRQNPEVEALVNGVNGLFYRSDSIDDMVRCWMRLLDDGVVRNRMARAALRTVGEKYTAANMVRGFVSTLSLAGWRAIEAAPLPFAAADVRSDGQEIDGHVRGRGTAVIIQTGS
jgi:glycosyltransferase involved in cell wall biosynthesis